MLCSWLASGLCPKVGPDFRVVKFARRAGRTVGRMTSEVYSLEELDQATRGYLHRVLRSKGRGFAGVYHGEGLAGPVLALLFGLMVIGFTVWFTFDALEAPPEPPLQMAPP